MRMRLSLTFGLVVYTVDFCDQNCDPAFCLLIRYEEIWMCDSSQGDLVKLLGHHKSKN